jgi:ABC-type polysaccharide transport system permease subunit
MQVRIFFLSRRRVAAIAGIDQELYDAAMIDENVSI